MIILKNKYEIRGEKTAIYLKRNNGEVFETIIDTADLKKAQEFPNSWCLCWSNDTKTYYCYGKLKTPDGKRVSVLLHRWISDCPSEMQVDHFDNNTLNNSRKDNLRFTKRFENHQNRAGCQRNSKSGIRGVSWNKLKNRWQASIKVNDKRKFLGYFHSVSEAEKVVKEARGLLMPYSKEAACI